MKKYFLLLGTVMMFAFPVTGCKDNVSNPIETDPFSFLKIGNNWAYDIIETLNDSIIDTGEKTLSLINSMYIEITVDAVKYAFFAYDGIEREISGNIEEISKGTLFISNDSSVCYYKKIGDDDFPLFWKNYTIGKKWDDDYFDDKIVREIVSTNETVTVEAGTFNNCIKIKEYNTGSNDEGYFFWWIKNDVGIIKVERGKYMEYIGKYYKYKLELRSKNF